jgi:hypothetical protein
VGDEYSINEVDVIIERGLMKNGNNIGMRMYKMYLFVKKRDLKELKEEFQITRDIFCCIEMDLENESRRDAMILRLNEFATLYGGVEVEQKGRSKIPRLYKLVKKVENKEDLPFNKDQLIENSDSDEELLWECKKENKKEAMKKKKCLM